MYHEILLIDFLGRKCQLSIEPKVIGKYQEFRNQYRAVIWMPNADTPQYVGYFDVSDLSKDDLPKKLSKRVKEWVKLLELE